MLFQRRTGMADVNINEWKFVLVVLASALACGTACADGPSDPAVASSDNGKYADKDGNPTYKISPDGVVDWYTYSGFRRYHSDCHVCHGPNGEGSSYAPDDRRNRYVDGLVPRLQNRRRLSLDPGGSGPANRRNTVADARGETRPGGERRA